MSGSADEATYLELSLAAFAGRVSAGEPAPGGGAVAAVATGLAAGLCAMVARLSTRQLSEAQSLADAAEGLRDKALALGEADAVAYEAVVSAWRLPRAPEPEERERRITSALSGAAEVPMALAELAAAVGDLAAHLAEAGNANLFGDALTAALLAEAAARAAAGLVAINLKASPGDVRHGQATSAAAHASNSARRAQQAH